MREDLPPHIDPEDAEATGDPSGEELDRIAKLADAQLEAEKEVAQKDKELSEAKERLRQISQEDLPTAMDEIGGGVGMKEFTLGNGAQIQMVEDTNASVSEDRAPEAYGWLRKHGHAAIIKNEVKLSFGKGEEPRAQEVKTKLQEEGYNPEQVENVHPQTLKKFVKEMEEQGEPVPEDLFGVFHFRYTKIKKG